jgi:hypothetical protein
MHDDRVSGGPHRRHGHQQRQATDAGVAASLRFATCVRTTRVEFGRSAAPMRLMGHCGSRIRCSTTGCQ